MTDTSLLTLARASTPALETVWRRLGALPAKVRVTEAHIDDGAVCELLEPLLGQPAWVLAAMLEAVLAERGSFVKVPAQTEEDRVALTPAAVEYRSQKVYGTTSPELVWSGTKGSRSCARDTRYVIEDLFADVRHEVMIAGYSFDHATDLFEPLFERAAQLTARGEPPPRVTVVLDASRTKASAGDTDESIAHKAAERFSSTCWRTDALPAEVLVYRPSLERKPDGFAPYSMHAKCIIVDREVALVGSANFSNRGRDRNLEAGALIRDHHFVQSLLAAWAVVRDELDPVPAR